ncbi:hypothetical protein LO80_06275 [Candidatus Francisella endociliophora]|uniref:Uncharacterized protein n=1 Tax=Candidatus Francisella endociliophora TaxID=653937 RepID=A0A097EPY7_9GAMM|nr:hypothetical protein [Francisella sp. FSC1006]AIT09606.1 hypothetical protein LO80_06275 [Francisella sp. FSC1006]
MKISKYFKKEKPNTDNQNIKKARQLIVQRGLKDKLSELHIIQNDIVEQAQLNHLIKKAKVVLLSKNSFISIAANDISLFINSISVNDLDKLTSKLGLRFEKINIHYEIGEQSSYTGELLKEIYAPLFESYKKPVVINFYTNANEQQVRNFNQVIAKENLFKIQKNPKKDQKIISDLTTKVISQESNIQDKYFCVKALGSIQKIFEDIYPNLEKATYDSYMFLLLNTKHNFHIKGLATNYPKVWTPKNIIFSSVVAILSGVFLFNTVREFNLRSELKTNKYFGYDAKNLKKMLDEQESNIDNSILLSSIYPASIKYKQAYRLYASALTNNVLLSKFSQTKELSSLIVFLIYFEYIDNNQLDDNTNKIIEILSNLSSISKEQLLYIAKYSSSATKAKILETASKQASKLYKDNKIEVDIEQKFKHILSLEGFNNEYLGISGSNRTEVISGIYRAYLNKCAIDSILPDLRSKYTVPKSIDAIFNLYQSRFASKSNNVCKSSFIKNLNSDVTTVIKYTSDIKAKSFKDIIKNIDTATNHLEGNDSEIKNKDAKATSDKISTALVQYIINITLNSAYKDKELPLFPKIDKKLLMEFKPNFYDNSVKISPQYSKAYINDNVLPLEVSFNKLLDNLSQKYHVKTDFLSSIYNDSLSSYKAKYIDRYNGLLSGLNSENIEFDKISNKESLNIYLISMSSKSSLFNDFIDFFRINTSIDTKGFEDIKDRFKNDDKYLNSKKYAEYREIFATLNSKIKKDGYIKTYKEIKRGYKPLQGVYSDLTELNVADNDELYILLKRQLDVAVEAIQNIALNQAISSINEDAEAEYSYLNNFLPFSFDGDKTVDDNKLVSDLGESGSVYVPFMKQLKPLLTYDRVKDTWSNPTITSSKHKLYLSQFNKVYHLNKLLWSGDNQPQKLKFEITPVPSKDYDYTFTSMLFNNKSYVNSLNVNYTDPVEVDYNWSSKEPVTIVVQLKDGQTIQKSYTGSWAVIKALKDAECSKDICTWDLTHNGKDYPVSFKVESKFIDTIKK